MLYHKYSLSAHMVDIKLCIKVAVQKSYFQIVKGIVKNYITISHTTKVNIFFANSEHSERN